MAGILLSRFRARFLVPNQLSLAMSILEHKIALGLFSREIQDSSHLRWLRSCYNPPS